MQSTLHAAGNDNTVIAARRRGMWFDEPGVFAGSQIPDGLAVAGLMVAYVATTRPLHRHYRRRLQSFDTLNGLGVHIFCVNVSEKALGTDQSGRLRFFNQRSELLWLMREALDPANDTGIALPPDKRLRADLCAFTWEMRGSAVFVHSRKQIISRIGRSPDWAPAFVLALKDSPKHERLTSKQSNERRLARLNYDPMGDTLGIATRKEHDPFACLA